MFIDSVTRSPLYSIYGETIAGVTIIRAFGASSKFLRDMLRCVDTVSHYFGTKCWLECLLCYQNSNPYYWMWGGIVVPRMFTPHDSQSYSKQVAFCALQLAVLRSCWCYCSRVLNHAKHFCFICRIRLGFCIDCHHGPALYGSPLRQSRTVYGKSNQN